ncbi:hypothetical protein PRIPAC_75537 [Pristionchus pacificus]|uniref:Uncharacterized protein n=1 Tax=Pristionchus pacificus TaxID=54126 RepID=A0A2A6B581_PRIPA|nr:hypothetical protein PRIPAC_75537 [Pristionchus pacificus]|eukprot:PDM61018.1 hypothetical protein PRIPAC_54824 [Pristionchus pacificus]
MFFSTIICQTLPVPSGVFGPTFVIGAAVGRLQGELMLLLFRDDDTEGLHVHPGVYAVVGSAAFSAAVTHSVSVSVMIFEMTGQLWLIIPTMIGTIVARAVSANFTISWIDNIIKLKHLPFLPDIPPNNDRGILLERMDLNVFPIVENKENEMLIGTVTRGYLLHVLEEQVGAAARKSEAEKRVRRAIETIDQHFTNGPTEQQVRRIFSDPRLRVSLLASTSNQHSIRRIPKVPEPRRVAVQHVFQVTPVRMPEYLQRAAVDPEVVAPRRGSANLPQRRNALFNVRETITEDEEEEEDSLTRPPASPTEDSSLLSSTGSEGQSLDSQGGGGDYKKVVNAYKKHARLLKKVVNKVTGSWMDTEEEENAYDLTPNEREEWENERLQQDFRIPDQEIDAAPSQLVRKTPLFKIHSIFSMLQINRAYVVDCGRLVGVVALADVRDALEHSLSDDPEKFDKSILPMTRKASVRSSVPEKVSDSLMPTLEVVGKAATMEADEAFVRREKDAIRRMTSLKSSQREDVHQLSIHKSNASSSEAEQLVEAVAYLRKISMSSDE